MPSAASAVVEGSGTSETSTSKAKVLLFPLAIDAEGENSCA